MSLILIGFTKKLANQIYSVMVIKKKKKKNALYLSVNVFSTKVLIGDTIFTSPTGDGTAILRGHPSHAKVYPFAGQREYLHFSVS